MPPRTTQKSHRPRVSDRTMVGNCHPLLASAQKAVRRTRTNMTPRTSHRREKDSRAQPKCVSAANRGWMSEKIPPPADRAKCFYLTSPFIEPACGAMFVTCRSSVAPVFSFRVLTLSPTLLRSMGTALCLDRRRCSRYMRRFARLDTVRAENLPSSTVIVY